MRGSAWCHVGHVAIRAVAAASLLAPSLGVGACSESQACSPQPVWAQNAAGFTYEKSGGYGEPLPPDSGCSDVYEVYQFSVSARILTHFACSESGPSASTVHLSDGEAMQIVTALEGLVTICPGSGCGADAPGIVLTVQPASGSPIAYNSDFYAGCLASSPPPPFISFVSLAALADVLNGIVNSACRPDAGADAGSCSQGLPDGGSMDAGISD